MLVFKIAIRHEYSIKLIMTMPQALDKISSLKLNLIWVPRLRSWDLRLEKLTIKFTKTIPDVNDKTYNYNLSVFYDISELLSISKIVSRQLLCVKNRLKTTALCPCRLNKYFALCIIAIFKLLYLPSFLSRKSKINLNLGDKFANIFQWSMIKGSSFTA